MHKYFITLLFLSANVFAANTYNPATNTLTMDAVIVGGTQYNNVAINLTGYKIISVGSSSPITSNTIVDSYDPTSNTLSIPYVMVGNTIYTNVVLKENSFNVVSFDPYPTVGQVIGGVLYNFNGCTIEGSTLFCSLTLTSQNTSITGGQLNMCSNNGVLIDNIGNTYVPHSVLAVAKVGNPCSLDRVTLPANTTILDQLIFNNIAKNASSVFQFSFSSANISGSNSYVVFGNSNFINSIAPYPF